MSALFDEVTAALSAAADPAKAPGMQAYMKSQLPFLGVQKAARTRRCVRSSRPPRSTTRR